MKCSIYPTLNTSHPSCRRGFTLVEILVSLAIILLLMGIGAYALIASRTAKQLDTMTDSITAKLEEAKSNAISGKNGTNFGLAFSTTTYVYWSGSSYSPGNANNLTYPVTNGFSITSTIPGTDHAIMFARITGLPNATGSITITSNQNASTTDTITIGTLGDITVVK